MADDYPEAARLTPAELTVMRELAERGRSHGYELADVLSGSCARSTVYTALRSVESKGLVKSDWQKGSAGSAPARKYYELTPHGRLRVMSARQ